MEISIIDAVIFVGYLIFMLLVGFYFMRKNKSHEDYFVGGRSMSAGHIGLSVVATDVGGGFSIGLGGLGFMMGISGSWMLFTGLIGAWLSAVVLIPRIYPLAKKHSFLTFPQTLLHHYNARVAFVAGIISLIGYIGFTSSQILAGAKLASATFPQFSLQDAALIMGVIAVVYTVFGGIKAVIYTDTIQWIILMVGLIGIGLPYGYHVIGGYDALVEYLPSNMLSLKNVTFSQILNWFITIVPIWFVGMTLYQRIYACKDEKTAKKAWYLAGVFEWPIMAFMGVLLGVFSRVAYEQGLFEPYGYGPGTAMDAELGLPMLLSHILPVGLMGMMMSAYFSAIMSTADSCLMAASGNFDTDILGFFKKHNKDNIRRSQLITLVIGIVAIIIATNMTNVLDLMLHSYAFMVSGLFVPVLAALFVPQPKPMSALWAMIIGGSTTLTLLLFKVDLPYDFDANLFGILASIAAFTIGQNFLKSEQYG
ncbi:MAG: sodium:solute symporter family protein [Crocinitomicaceae bacterium]|jgi:SSS family solute:Na+ symporter|nr:sodium:solute symporter family protein [Crocinitomicaceae bacterium]